MVTKADAYILLSHLQNLNATEPPYLYELSSI